MNTSTARSEEGEGLPSEGEIIDVEQYAKEGREIPRGARYRIRIDKRHYEVGVPGMTGRELLGLAGKMPPERFRIDQKLRGGQTRQVGLDQHVEFTEPGVERFMTLPLDQTEG